MTRWLVAATAALAACSGSGADNQAQRDGGGTGVDAARDRPRAALTVLVHGSGRVTSTPAGIDCTDACAAYFEVGSSVSLSAVPADDWQLDEFRGACTGTDCTVTVSDDATVEADFEGRSGLAWFLPIGNDAKESIYGAVLVEGDVVVVGEFHGELDLGAGPIAGAPTGSLFIARFDAGGALAWATTVDGPALLTGSPIAATPAGDILITGLYAGTTDFGGESLTSSGRTDFFVAKLSGSSGALMWVNGAGGIEIDAGRAVASDPDGNALVTGYYRRGIDFGDGIVDGAYWGSSFVAKYADTDGALMWYAVDYTDIFLAEGRAITSDADGNVIVAGLQKQTGSEAEFPDGFASKLSAADGTRVWTFELDERAASWVAGVAAAPDGGAFLAGSYRGTVSVVGTEYVSGASGDIFVARLDDAGAPSWFASHGNEGYEFATGVALRPDGNLSVSAGFSDRIDFDDTAFVVSAGGIDALHAVFGPEGAFVSAEAFGGPEDDDAQAVAVDANRRVVTGSFAGTIDVRGVSYESRGSADGFIYVVEE